MKKWLLLLSTVMFCGLAYSQTILLYNEDFEGVNPPFTLNGNGNGTNEGYNKWIINNQYNGAPVYPNTTTQDQTSSGTISFAPTSKYLHINDSATLSNQNIGNANFDFAQRSDRFAYTTDGFCTLGFTNVYFSFFWLCEGNNDAYGEVYYSLNNGPWVQTGLNQYKDQSLWKYEVINNPIFDNQPNIRFGFKWVNGPAGAAASQSFAIDDIFVLGTYSQATGVQINISELFPLPVCQGTGVFIRYNLTSPLCDGTYNIDLSDSLGNFANPTNLGVFDIINNDTDNYIYPIIPGNIPPGNCYKMRINRVAPAPAITGNVSICFAVAVCPNIIETLEPVVTTDPDTVCAGSVIDVPFYSTGVYVNNTYVAQLSRPDGTFPQSPPYTVLGVFPNSATYDENEGSPPGNVSGLIPDTVSEGCNYYIRVNSINPIATGSLYGPFCIKHCDIETNDQLDISVCINENEGAVDTIIYTIHNYDNTAVYSGTNQFLVQVLNSQTLNVINTGILGATVSSQSGTVVITIPNLSGLFTLGMVPGMYYLRIVASDSNLPWDLNGTLIRIIIGAPSAFKPVISADAPFYCAGDVGAFYIAPDHSYFPFYSTYEWTCNAINNGNPFFWENPLFVNLNGTGTLEFSVVEHNNGCEGPKSDVFTVDVFGAPNITINGPSKVCMGDTVTYTAAFTNNTAYQWTLTPTQYVTVLDNSNNSITLVFDSLAATQIKVKIINPCAENTGTKTIIVKDYPDAVAGNDTLICAGSPINLNVAAVPTASYEWGITNGPVVGSNNPQSVTPNQNTNYYVKVTTAPNCSSYDTLIVLTEAAPDTVFDTTHVCIGETTTFDAGAGQGYTYVWNTGETTQTITKAEQGQYIVDISIPTDICLTVKAFYIDLDTCYVPLQLPNVFTPNGDNTNEFWQPYAVGEFDEFEIIVYNRWGTTVFKTNNPKVLWDAKDMGGKLVSDGVYYYVANTMYADKKQELHGTVTVLKEK